MKKKHIYLEQVKDLRGVKGYIVVKTINTVEYEIGAVLSFGEGQQLANSPVYQVHVSGKKSGGKRILYMRVRARAFFLERAGREMIKQGSLKLMYLTHSFIPCLTQAGWATNEPQNKRPMAHGICNNYNDLLSDEPQFRFCNGN